MEVVPFFCEQLIILLLAIGDMVNDVTWETIYAETHCLCHLSKAFSFNLMLEWIRGEVCTFSVNLGLDKSKRSTNTIQRYFC